MDRGDHFPVTCWEGGARAASPRAHQAHHSLTGPPSLPTYEGEGSSLKKETKPFPSGLCCSSLDIAARWSTGAGGERQTRAGGHGVGREMETRTEREKRVMESCRQAGHEGCLAARPLALSQRR